MRALLLIFLCLTANAQWQTNFFGTNYWATNVPGFTKTLRLEWWMQCHPELLTDTVQVAVEYKTNALAPWLLKTQWMQGLDQNPRLLVWAFTASNRQEFYRIRSTRIYP